MQRPPRRYRVVLALAGMQILLDLVCLTALAMWTGGVRSPVLGFYVFHMVFASLLLRRWMAFAGSAAAAILLAAGLVISDQWPQRDPSGQLGRPLLILAGWTVTLLLTVYLANHITLSLRRHRRRLQRRNRHVRALVKRLRQQQQAMVQHEKVVALGHMAAGVAHEIANPLASIDSVLQLMARNPQRLNEANLDKISQPVDRIKQTIQQLSNYAHPTDYQWQTARIDDVVEQSLQMLRFDRRHRAIQIERHFDAGDCAPRVQPHAMQQVLINLLRNAVDAVADVPEPRLVVSTRRGDGECRVSIRDNGPGIATDNLDQIFDPFFTTKPVGEGTGLGLAISESLLRNQGGRIEVASEPGQGATFNICLPLDS